MHTAMRVNGVFVAVVVAQSVVVLIGVMLFRRGRWAQKRI
jgi:Na+-driven multidrug efflux pump